MGQILQILDQRENGSYVLTTVATPIPNSLAICRYGLPARFTSDPAGEYYGVFSPDGGTVVFNSTRKGYYDLYRKPASGAGAPGDIVHPEIVVAKGVRSGCCQLRPVGRKLNTRTRTDIGTFRISLRVANEVGCRCIITDAYRDRISWSEKYGFVPIEGAAEGGPLRMFLNVRTVRAALRH